MALAGSKFGLLARAKERAIRDSRRVVSAVPVALRVCGEAEKCCSEEKSNNAREMYSVMRNYYEHEARNTIWAHVTLT